MNKYSLVCLFTIIILSFSLQVKNQAKKHLMNGRIAGHNYYDSTNYQQEHQSQNDDLQHQKAIYQHKNEQNMQHESDIHNEDMRYHKLAKHQKPIHDQYSQTDSRYYHDDQMAQIDRNARAHLLFGHQSTQSYHHNQQVDKKTRAHRLFGHSSTSSYHHNEQVDRKIKNHKMRHLDDSTSSYTSSSDFRHQQKSFMLNRNHQNMEDYENKQNHQNNKLHQDNYSKNDLNHENQNSIQQHDEYSRQKYYNHNKNLHKTAASSSEQPNTQKNILSNQQNTTNDPKPNMVHDPNKKIQEKTHKMQDTNNMMREQQHESKHHNKRHQVQQPMKQKHVTGENDITHEYHETNPNQGESQNKHFNQSPQQHLLNLHKKGEDQKYHHNQNDLDEPDNGAHYTYIDEYGNTHPRDYTTRQDNTRTGLNYGNMHTESSTSTSSYYH